MDFWLVWEKFLSYHRFSLFSKDLSPFPSAFNVYISINLDYSLSESIDLWLVFPYDAKSTLRYGWCMHCIVHCTLETTMCFYENVKYWLGLLGTEECAS